MDSLKETIVIDDVITLELQNKFHDMVLNSPNWRFIKDMSYANFEMKYPSYGFNQMFKDPYEGIVSDLYEQVSLPIAYAISNKTGLNLNNIYFNRAFLQVPLDHRCVKEHNGIHIDIPQEHYACVYYMNDSDGDTIIYDQTMHNTVAGSKNVKLKEHKRVTPKKGRVVLFDGARYHCSSQPRNNYRCIINFDFI